MRAVATVYIEIFRGTSLLVQLYWIFFVLPLFGVNLDDLKDTVYTMRYDTASALYAEFGPFYVGMAGPVEEIVARTA